MQSHLRQLVLETTGAQDLFAGGTIQSLWSGYGSIDRYGLIDSTLDTVVVKHVRMPDGADHPRGWNTDLSHQRKLRSYQVETAWYEHWAERCDEACRIPRCLAVEHQDNEVLMVLEDLDAGGFPARRNQASASDMTLCLNWLAHFHATFMGETPSGLWETGTYWHLETRPDELAAMENGELKQAAVELDRTLSEAPFQTVVHGDAKLANFCFAQDGKGVAAVDFQPRILSWTGCGVRHIFRLARRNDA